MRNGAGCERAGSVHGFVGETSDVHVNVCVYKMR
jgi:hypothetical protein